MVANSRAFWLAEAARHGLSPALAPKFLELAMQMGALQAVDDLAEAMGEMHIAVGLGASEANEIIARAKER